MLVFAVGVVFVIGGNGNGGGGGGGGGVSLLSCQSLYLSPHPLRWSL